MKKKGNASFAYVPEFMLMQTISSLMCKISNSVGRLFLKSI